MIFDTFPHFFTLFQNISPRTSPLKTKGFSSWEQKRRKDNKKNWTNRCCTLVVARLSLPYKCKYDIGFSRGIFFGNSNIVQDDGKGGLGLIIIMGVAFMTVVAVLTVLAVLESTLPSFCLAYKIQCRETTVTLLTVLAVSAVSVVTATPLKLNPPFPSSWIVNSV